MDIMMYGKEFIKSDLTEIAEIPKLILLLVVMVGYLMISSDMNLSNNKEDKLLLFNMLGFNKPRPL
jgi:hypothetical protein